MKKKIKEVFNSPAYKKWAKNMEELENVFNFDIVLTPYRVVGKKKGKKK